MKTFSKKELNAKAAPVFKEHPNASVLYGTSDGQFFLNKNRAELHASANKLSVHGIEAPSPQRGEITKEPEGSMTVDEIRELAEGTADKTVLEHLLNDERNGKNRKTAIAAITDRLEELEAAKELQIIDEEQEENENEPNENEQ